MQYNSSILSSDNHLKGIEDNINPARVFSYYSGSNGTAAVASGESVIEIRAYNDTGIVAGAASLSIDGGASIDIPANSPFDLSFIIDSLQGPINIVFTDSSSYYVGVVTNA